MRKRITQYQGVQILYPKSKEKEDTIAKSILRHKKPVIKVYQPKLFSKRCLNHEMAHINMGHVHNRNVSPVQYWIDEVTAERYALKKEGRSEFSLRHTVNVILQANDDFNKYRKKKLSLMEYFEKLKHMKYRLGITASEFNKAYKWAVKNYNG